MWYCFMALQMGFRGKGEVLDGWMDGWMDGGIPIRLYCIRAPVVLIKLLTGEKTRSGNEQLCQDLRLFSIWQGVRFSWKIWLAAFAKFRHITQCTKTEYFILMVRWIGFRLLVSAKIVPFSGSDTLWYRFFSVDNVNHDEVDSCLVSVLNNSENEDDDTIVGDKKIDFRFSVSDSELNLSETILEPSRAQVMLLNFVNEDSCVSVFCQRRLMWFCFFDN